MLTRKRFLERLLQLQQQMTVAGDPEEDHRRADELLLQALQFFAAQHSPDVQEVVATLIAQYNSFEKWYA